MSSQDIESIQNELKWVKIREIEEQSFFAKLASKGIIGFLVPTGCLATTGVLMAGLYQLIKKNRKNQQLLMRYRVAAQGITVLIAMIGIVAAPIKNTKSK